MIQYLFSKIIQTKNFTKNNTSIHKTVFKSRNIHSSEKESAIVSTPHCHRVQHPSPGERPREQQLVGGGRFSRSLSWIRTAGGTWTPVCFSLVVVVVVVAASARFVTHVRSRTAMCCASPCKKRKGKQQGDRRLSKCSENAENPPKPKQKQYAQSAHTVAGCVRAYGFVCVCVCGCVQRNSVFWNSAQIVARVFSMVIVVRVLARATVRPKTSTGHPFCRLPVFFLSVFVGFWPLCCVLHNFNKWLYCFFFSFLHQKKEATKRSSSSSS